MFLEKLRGLYMKNWHRAIISLVIGACLTFVVPTIMNSIWPYIQDERFQVPSVVLAASRILNLPAVLYCALFTLPSGLPKGDESLFAGQ
ncbi:MAG: hypothetical protein M3X11_22930 [Acidobacteriota bacterium]|nr:hypothetical protein [Acidobacteriota bacterium]